jgi:RNA polymerase sigma-70 factor (ECF subfamily)
VVRALPGFRGETDLRVFVARVAEHRCIDHVARAVRRRGDVEIDAELPNPAPGPERQAELGQRVDRLARALEALPLGLREAAVLALEGFEPREVGAVLGLTANTAAQRMKRARDALRTALDGEDGE